MHVTNTFYLVVTSWANHLSFLKRVFLWPNVALNPNMTLKINFDDVLGLLFTKILLAANFVYIC